MKNQTYVIFTIIFAIIISIFAVLNVGAVEVDYLFWSGKSPLIFVILFSVLLGGILTTAFGTGKYLKLKRQNKVLEKRVHELEQQMIDTDQNFSSADDVFATGIEDESISKEHSANDK